MLLGMVGVTSSFVHRRRSSASAAVRRVLAEGLEHDFLRDAVEREIEVALALALQADAGDGHTELLAVHVDEEVRGHRRRTPAVRLAGGAAAPRLERALGARFEEAAADVREHRVGEHVLLARREVADLLAQRVELRRNQVRRAAVDRALRLPIARAQLASTGAGAAP